MPSASGHDLGVCRMVISADPHSRSTAARSLESQPYADRLASCGTAKEGTFNSLPCIGRGDGEGDTARPRLSMARKEVRVASTSAALPYLALRAASSAGVGGGLRGALVAIRLRRLSATPAKSARTPALACCCGEEIDR